MLYEFALYKKYTPVQIFLVWMLHKNDFVILIPGMRKDERIVENLGAANVELTEEKFRAIENKLSF